jgi:membrane-associated PAP2 superfamily phosphatase
LLFAATIPFLGGSLDFRLQSLFYRSTGAAWPYESWPLWKFLYTFGPWPALIVAAAALAAFIKGFRYPKLAKWRRHCLYLFLVLVIGPGLLVNAIFKDHWGRPRPRQTTEFGGQWQFRHILERGTPGKGKSFPSGHSSTGYYFVAFYFLLRRRRKLLAALTLAGTAIYGTLIGIARMAAGAHFASDVLWSAVFPTFAAFILYYFILRIPAHEDRLNAPPVPS